MTQRTDKAHRQWLRRHALAQGLSVRRYRTKDRNAPTFGRWYVEGRPDLGDLTTVELEVLVESGQLARSQDVRLGSTAYRIVLDVLERVGAGSPPEVADAIIELAEVELGLEELARQARGHLGVLSIEEAAGAR